MESKQLLRLKERLQRNKKRIQTVSYEKGHTYRGCFANANCETYSWSCFFNKISCDPFITCDGNKDCKDCRDSYTHDDIDNIIVRNPTPNDAIHYYTTARHICGYCIDAAVLRFREVNYYLEQNKKIEKQIDNLEYLLTVDAYRRAQSDWSFDINIVNLIVSFVDRPPSRSKMNKIDWDFIW